MSSDVTLQDIKLELKVWENEFMKCNQRKANSNDIKAAPQKIRDAYKSYWKAKKPTGNTGSWGKHLNKDKRAKCDEENDEKSCDLDVFCEKIAKVPLTKKAPELTVKRVLSAPRTKNETVLWDSDFTIKKTYSDKSLHFKRVNAASGPKLSYRERKVDHGWLNRCSEKIDEKNDEKLDYSEQNDEKLDCSEQNEGIVEENEEIVDKRPKVIEKNQESDDKRSKMVEKDEENDDKRFNFVEFDGKDDFEERKTFSEASFVHIDVAEANVNGEKRVLSDFSPPICVKTKKVNQDGGISLKNEKKMNLLEKKMKSNSANDNFVRIDIRKKKFHRGKKAFSAVKYKRKKWAMKQKFKDNVSTESECFRCGQTGHWIKNCPLKTGRSKKDIERRETEVEDEIEDASPFLTLEEAAALATGVKSRENTVKVNVYSVVKEDLAPEKPKKRLRIDEIDEVSVENEGKRHKMDENIVENEGKRHKMDQIDENIVENEGRRHKMDQIDENIVENEGKRHKMDEIDENIVENEGQRHKINEIDENIVENEGKRHKMDDIEEKQHKIDEIIKGNDDSSDQNVKPMFEMDENGEMSKTPKFVFDTLKKFGYDRFRPGQEETIMRILSGLSTLLVLSTGAGKSLCYQLPAYLYAQKSNCITLVISPLVSLMEDQVTGLPSCLKAVCLHSNLTTSQRKKSLDAISSGKVHIILISPEMAVGGKAGFGLPVDLPPIAFACIDEAHCVSEWSHNFRPSYLRLHKVLRDRFKVKCILALTATATSRTAGSVAEHLGINGDKSGIIRGNIIPSNLCLSVSRDDNKDEAVISLLKGDRFSSSCSILIYCTRREQTERLATVLRTCLRDDSSTGLNLIAEAYHAGLSAAKRRSVQNAFMSGKLRIVAATVAFGMGLDKADVRSIIHYNMPRRFESYVQEIGRAGRDGKKAHCHLFLDSRGGDLMELRRHIFANDVDRSTLRKLVRDVFPTCKCAQNDNFSCRKHEVALPIEELVQKLDLKEENISTLLCYLELSPEKWIDILNPVYSWCKIFCYDGPKQLKTASIKCPPMAAAIALDLQSGQNHDKSSSVEFPIVSVASRMGWDSGIVKREIKGLEWNQANGKFRKSGIMTEFSKLAFHFMAPGNFNGDQMDRVLDYLNSYVGNQKKSELKQLEASYEAFYTVSKPRFWSCSDSYDEAKSDQLKGFLTDYFDGRAATIEEPIAIPKLDVEKQRSHIQSDIRAFLGIYHDQTFAGRSIARIFCGIDSPCFPAQVWGRVRRFWRSHLDVDFDLLCKWATQELIRLK